MALRHRRTRKGWKHLVESGGALGKEFAARLDHAMGQREAEARSEELLDVGTSDVAGLLDLGDLENLCKTRDGQPPKRHVDALVAMYDHRH